MPPHVPLVSSRLAAQCYHPGAAKILPRIPLRRRESLVQSLIGWRPRCQRLDEFAQMTFGSTPWEPSPFLRRTGFFLRVVFFKLALDFFASFFLRMRGV